MPSLILVSTLLPWGLVYWNTQPISVTVPWDADSFANSIVAHRIPPNSPLAPAPADNKLMSEFPTPKFGPFKTPTTLVDCHGHILIWYLPGVLDSTTNVGYVSTWIWVLADTSIGYHDECHQAPQRTLKA